MAAGAELLEAYGGGAGRPYDGVRAAHLLNRAGFGGTVAEVEEVVRLGPAGAADRLLAFADQGVPAGEGPDLSAVAAYPATTAGMTRLYERMTEVEAEATKLRHYQANHEAVVLIVQWWLTRMRRAAHPLQEKLALFWHGHFATSVLDTYLARLTWAQNELLRSHAAGNFRALVKRICRDPAMLDYLNNSMNVKAHANENFARELMELFTIGIGNYSEDDVREAARAFTGWGHDGAAFYFDPSEHDDGEKTVLGLRGRLDGDDVVDRLCDHPACARFIVRRLFEYFVYESPEEEVVDGLARRFVASGLELRPLLRTMFTSRAFYSERAMGTQIKSPVQVLVGTARLLELELPEWRETRAFLKDAGQLPFLPPDPRGWPGGRTWINTTTLLARYNFGATMAARLPAGERVPPGEAGRVVDGWVGRLVQRPIEGAQRATLVEALRETGDVREVVALILGTGEYQLC